MFVIEENITKNSVHLFFDGSNPISNVLEYSRSCKIKRGGLSIMNMLLSCK